MKKYKIFILILIAGSLFSCDYLDIVPDNVATIDHAFSNKYNARRYLMSTYGELPDLTDINDNPALLGGDELWEPSVLVNRVGVKLAKGEQGVTSPIFDKWGGLYKAIRKCNVFLDEIGKVEDLPEWERKQWIAEVNFLKAYYHFYLIRMYGPIIINDEAIPVYSSIDNIKQKRDPLDDCFNYVVELLDKAIVDLPLIIESEGVDMGRATKPIAAAVKAQVLMTAASPLFNGNPDHASFKTADGKDLFSPTYSEQKWKDAAQASLEAIDLAESAGFGLYLKDDYIPQFELNETIKYKAALRSRVTERWNKEIIWGCTRASVNTIQHDALPKLFPTTGNEQVRGRYCPTLRIAELYYSQNGVPIDEDVNFDYENRLKTKVAGESDKYVIQPGETTAILNFDRELRFYADLAFDRSVWFGNGTKKPGEFWVLKARQGEYSSFSSADKSSVTGYYAKKLVNLNTVILDDGRAVSRYRYAFPIIRMADLYLYYAEALNESKAQPDAQVYEYVDRVRERAGLAPVVESWANFSINPGKPTTKSGMRDIIRQERLIELSLEGKRFWDLKRWKLSKDYMNKTIKGWSTGYNSIENYYVVKDVNKQTYSMKDYLWPIRESEIIKNPNLIQNPGW
ncbi:RagB/SusD family nutrient uptake outer membrane protein [Mariniphaga sediminis]|uniref:RagB/SusD family nutrient uptake outer membrane protein n=1 Tax=Mariniphaga sediminis TaxID=1628158 RepID=UPI0035660739